MDVEVNNSEPNETGFQEHYLVYASGSNRRRQVTMTLSDKDHFVLVRTIRGIQERVREVEYNSQAEEYDRMLEGLVDICNEMHRDYTQHNSFACSKCGVVFTEEAGGYGGFVCEDCKERSWNDAVT